MKSYVATTPTTISICSSYDAFYYYYEGVLDSNCGECTDHAVLAVGYGHDPSTGLDYWKIKNSWGSNWGEGGFAKILRTNKIGPGTCGVLKEMTYPVLL